MTILLVGDKPSRKNLDPEVAFKGTQSWKKIGLWFEHMRIYNGDFIVRNRVSSDLEECLKLRLPTIAFGREAEKHIRKLGYDCFYMPHPSGRNRLLNNKEYVIAKLQECNAYLCEEMYVRRMFNKETLNEDKRY